MSRNWMDSKEFWQDKRVIVTGGAGFLGSFVVEKLAARGAAEVVVPRSAEYDLTQLTAIEQLLADTRLAGKPMRTFAPDTGRSAQYHGSPSSPRPARNSMRSPLRALRDFSSSWK